MDKEKNYLENYRKEDYERLSLAVDILVFTLDEKHYLNVLLKKRKNFPYKNMWGLPGGFVEPDESLEDASNRVLLEKTGLKNLHMEQLYTFGSVNRDPRMRIVSVAYIVFIPRSAICSLDADSEFFKVTMNEDNSINFESLAFDHKEMIEVALSRIAGKLHYTDIAMELLKDTSKFTIYELQKVFEAIDSKVYDTPNFRRYFKNRYESTGRVEKLEESSREFSKRPSSYYKFIG